MNEILEASPPVLLAACLNIVGYYLKKSPIKDWYIPFILLILGMIAYPFICESGVRLGKMIIQGACIGGLAVALNQGLRQFLSRNDDGGNTTFFKNQQKDKTNETVS